MDFADPETAPTILPFTKFEIMGESEMLWARLLAYVAGTMNQELLLRNEYLAADNRILRGQIKGRLLLSEGRKGDTGRDRSSPGSNGRGGRGGKACLLPCPIVAPGLARHMRSRAMEVILRRFGG